MKNKNKIYIDNEKILVNKEYINISLITEESTPIIPLKYEHTPNIFLSKNLLKNFILFKLTAI